MASTTTKLLTSYTTAQKWCEALLVANHLSPHHASTIAKALTLADLRGIDTHGLLRLPSYLSRVRAGALSATSSPVLTQTTPCIAQITGHNAFGHLSAALAIDTACSMAETYGIGMVSVKGSNHFGMSAWICMRALEWKGGAMCSLVFTNSSPGMCAWGGREKVLGVSPLAAGAPGPRGGGRDFVLDMAPSVVARGKVHKALRRGESIPEGWALDGEGKPTTDPEKALEGVMLPMGGPKGSGLAVMMDIFSGVLSGSAFAGGVQGPYEKDAELSAADVGHFIVAIKPGLFVGEEEFRVRMGVLYDSVTGAERMEGRGRIFFPGELEQICMQERERTGIPFTEDEVESLNAEAERVGVPKLEVMGSEG